MTELDLSRLKALAEAATTGPWEIEIDDRIHRVGAIGLICGRTGGRQQ